MPLSLYGSGRGERGTCPTSHHLDTKQRPSAKDHPKPLQSELEAKSAFGAFSSFPITRRKQPCKLTMPLGKLVSARKCTKKSHDPSFPDVPIPHTLIEPMAPRNLMPRQTYEVTDLMNSHPSPN